MNSGPGSTGDVRVLPVTAERLADLERFSTEHGTFRYCSCMRWRLSSTEFRKSSKQDRVAALAGLVDQGVPIGVLAYAGPAPVGWCSIAPRTTYRALERYRGLPRLDDAPVWSVVCFFVDRHHRSRGLAVSMLRGAVRYAREEGAEVVEGYPVSKGALYNYMGTPEVFREAGFDDVTPAGQARTVMRWYATAGGR
jgi:GNAT superfamily N-acetyltransferase